MESDVRKLLVNKIAKNIYEALLHKRNDDSWQHQLVTSGNDSWSHDSDDSLMASILESVHGTLGGDEGNGFEDRRKSERYVPIPLTVEELNSNKESRSGLGYQVPTPNCSKYQAPSPKYHGSSSEYQVPSPKNKARSSTSPKSSKKSGVRWATMPEESAAVVVDEDCSREFDELYYSSVVTSHKKTDRGVAIFRVFL